MDSTFHVFLLICASDSWRLFVAQTSSCAVASQFSCGPASLIKSLRIMVTILMTIQGLGLDTAIILCNNTELEYITTGTIFYWTLYYSTCILSLIATVIPSQCTVMTILQHYNIQSCIESGVMYCIVQNTALCNTWYCHCQCTRLLLLVSVMLLCY